MIGTENGGRSATLSFEDAKLMLVFCSAFVNYLRAKAAKGGIGTSEASRASL